MSCIDLIQNPKFKYLLDKYLNYEGQEINYMDYFNHFVDNLRKNEIIIPVLGIQGAGKSSFLNSILMEENILPTDVDETTCVPVEVKYGTDTNCAEVCFFDGGSKIISVEDLEKYVHNDYNEGNILGVSKIVLYNKSEILKNNIVLVDLPGVGSLTPENQKTTLDYVNKLAAGIFMIRTNPPITRTERNFINALWPKLSNTIFVQNQWNDETLEDVLDAKDHNEMVLNGIAGVHKDKRDVKVNIVNVYQAVCGKFSHDADIYSRSGIDAVIEEIKQIPEVYNKELIETLEVKIHDTILNLEQSIESYKISSFNKSIENERNKEVEIENLQNVLSENKNNFKRIRRYASNEMDDIIYNSEQLIKKKIELLKSELRRIINKGIVDGDRLSLIYKDVSDKVINELMEEILSMTGELINNLNIELQGIKIKSFKGKYENISFFNKKSSFKFENSLPSVLGLGSGVIGTMGAAGSFGGPVGILIGMSVGLVFSIIGEFMKKEITKTRASYTLRDLEPMIEDLENYLKEEILDDLRAKKEEVDDSIKELRRNSEKSLRSDMDQIESKYDYVYTENHREEFERDLKILNEIKETMGM